MRITIACPQAMIDDANQLAMALNARPEDALTFREPEWRDADGNAFACASFETDVSFVQKAQSGLQRPAWDTPPYVVNLTGAERAQAALVLHDGLGNDPVASPVQLVAISGVPGSEALTALGIEQIASQGDDFVLPHLVGS